MKDRLPTHQPTTPCCQPHLQVGRLATISPLDILVAKILDNYVPLGAAGTKKVTSLSSAYLRYWSLAETESLESFREAYREIARLEAQAEPTIAWRTLRDAATAYYAETGLCPFCRERGSLHLPAEQISGELSDYRAEISGKTNPKASVSEHPCGDSYAY